jgi:hypothetical protein
VTGGIVKAEGFGDGLAHGNNAIANPCLRRGDVIPAQAGIRLTMPPTRLGDFAFALNYVRLMLDTCPVER